MKNYGVWFGDNHGRYGFCACYGLTVSANSKKEAEEIALEILNTCCQEDLESYAMSDYFASIAKTIQDSYGFDHYRTRVERI